MDFFIIDTQTRIDVAEKQLKCAKTSQERQLLEEKIKDLHTLKGVLEEIRAHSQKDEMISEKVR